MEIMAKHGDEWARVLVDDEDGARITGRLSIGSHGYAQGFFNGRVELLHRWLLGLQYKDGMIGDHINGDKLDNRQANLRAVDASMSSSNVKHTQASGYRGVYPNHRRWMAKGKLHGKAHYLGTFDTPEEAAGVAQRWREENLPGYVAR